LRRRIPARDVALAVGTWAATMTGGVVDLAATVSAGDNANVSAVSDGTANPDIRLGVCAAEAATFAAAGALVSTVPAGTFGIADAGEVAAKIGLGNGFGTSLDCAIACNDSMLTAVRNKVPRATRALMSLKFD
jgi:hypothetical protein